VIRDRILVNTRRDSTLTPIQTFGSGQGASPTKPRIFGSVLVVMLRRPAFGLYLPAALGRHIFVLLHVTSPMD